MAPGFKTMSAAPPSPGKRRPSDCAEPKSPPPSDPQSLKKTRDLPNLTECQACGARTDTANGKNRIQTLYSEWRIVLLCPSCHHRVDSALICSYCFNEVSGDCYSCGQCKRSLHKTCFLNYKSVPPWSYSVSGSDPEFRVCIDCWVPEPIARKRGILRGRRNDKNSRVLDERDGGGGAKLLEDVVKDANCAMEKKVDAAVKAREMAVKKAVVAKRAVELASNALEGCDDAELAFRLHMAMNSSPRILKNRILFDQNGLEPLIAGNRGLSCLKPTEIVYDRRRRKPTEIVYDRRRKKPALIVYEKKPTEIVYEQRRNKPKELVYERRRNKPKEMVYVRRRKKSYNLVSKEETEHSKCKERCHLEIGMEREESCFSLLSNSSVADSGMRSDYHDDLAVSDGKLVPYSFTYSRKKSNQMKTSNGKTKFLYEGYNLESHATAQMPET